MNLKTLRSLSLGAIALSRQKLPYVSEHNSGENMSAKGAYVLKKNIG